MKILFVADYITHEPEIPEDLDLIVLLGDLKPELLYWLNNINVPKIGVYGNHCNEDYFDFYKVKNMHLNKTTIKGLSFFGIEGCVKYKNDDKQYSQKEYNEMLRKFDENSGVDVFLAHCPPEGINDNPQDSSHLGISGLKSKLHNVGLFVHGHSYPDNIWSVHNNTWILYVHGYELVDLKALPERSSLPIAKSYGSKDDIVKHNTSFHNFFKE